MSASTTNGDAALVLLSLAVGLPAVLVGVVAAGGDVALAVGLSLVPPVLALWRAARS
jgi:hypothetical protein